jgi:hypothetical protein
MSGILLRVKEGSCLEEVFELVLKFVELAVLYLTGLESFKPSVFTLGFTEKGSLSVVELLLGGEVGTEEGLSSDWWGLEGLGKLSLLWDIGDVYCPR